MISPEGGVPIDEQSPLLQPSGYVRHEEPDALFGVEPARYLALLGYFLTNTCNAMIWISFSGIVKPVKEFYGITSSQVDNISSIYMIMYIATFWLSGLVLSKVGLGWGMVAASLLNAMAMVCRLMTLYATRSYALLLTGNVLGGICQVLILSAPPMLSNQWFGLEERALATGVGVATAYVGSALGMVIPVALVNSGTVDEFSKLYWLQFAFAAVAFTVCLVAKKQPSLPPTPAALAHDEHKPDPARRSFSSVSSKRQSMRASLRLDRSLTTTSSKNDVDEAHNTEGQSALMNFYLTVFKPALKTIVILSTDRSFLLLVLVAGMGQGIVWEISTFIGQFGEPFGISQSTIGWVGFTAQVTGCGGAVGLGAILGKFSNYKSLLIATSVAYIIFATLFPLAGAITSYGSKASEDYTGDSSCDGIATSNSTTQTPCQVAPWPGGLSSTAATILMFISVSACTLCASVQCPVIFELGVETTFPIPEEVASPLIMWAPSLISFVLVQLLGLVLGEEPTRSSVLIVMYVNIGCTLLLAAAVALLNPEYKRRDYERQQLLEIAEESNAHDDNVAEQEGYLQAS